MSSLANLPSAISLVLKRTTGGQQHRNRNPETFLLGPGGTGGAIMSSVQPLDSEISGRLLTNMGSSGSRIQPRSESEIAPTASIVSLPCNALTSSEGFGR